MPQIWKTINIFISSTFSDMQFEREHLKNIVFPKLDVELRQRQAKLHVSDLRWGINTSEIKDEKERESMILKVCLDEIVRCRPFFIGLLGDRYGWVPDEERMKLERERAKLDNSEKGKSVTALEIEFGVLASKEQLVRSVFFFRNPLEYKKFPPQIAAKYCDAFDPNLSPAEKGERKKLLDDLKNDIKEHFKKEDSSEKVKAYDVVWDKANNKVTGLEEWGETVYKAILEECEKEMIATWNKLPKNWIEQEILLLDEFIEDRTQTFCGRKELIEELKKFLIEDNSKNWGIILTGESGSGKSSVFSKLVRILKGDAGNQDKDKDQNRKNDYFVLAHSAGVSSRSQTIADLLRIWIKQLNDFLGFENEPDELEMKERSINPLSETLGNLEQPSGFHEKTKKLQTEKLQEKFIELLYYASEKRRIVILLDALDRFERTERAKHMSWIPGVLPANTRLLCTAITGTEKDALSYHDGLLPKNIDFFSPEEAKITLDALCKYNHKELNQKIVDSILAKVRNDKTLSSGSPLWLSLAVNIMLILDRDDFEKMSRLEGKGGEVIDKYMLDMVNDFSPLPGDLFRSLLDKAGKFFGEEFTGSIFTYIAVSRNGLRETDLSALLEKKLWDELKFASLRRWFRTHLVLQGEENLWNLAHSILRDSVKGRFTIAKAHDKIADHLQELPETDSLRVSETMYHLLKTENPKSISEYYSGDISVEESESASDLLAEFITTDKKWLDLAMKLPNYALSSDPMFLILSSNFTDRLNNALAEEGNIDIRLQVLEKTDDVIKKVENRFEGIDNFIRMKAKLYLKLGELYKLSGNPNRALEYLELSYNLSNGLKKSDHEIFKDTGALSAEQLGEVYETLGQIDKALEFFMEGNKLLQVLLNSKPEDKSMKYNLASSFGRLGEVCQRLGQFDKALEYLETEKKLFEELNESDTFSNNYKNGLAGSYGRLGDLFTMTEQYDNALKYFELKNKLNKELYESNPKSETFKHNFAGSFERLGKVYLCFEQYEKSLKFFEQYLLLLKELHQSSPKNLLLQKAIGLAYDRIGGTYWVMKQSDLAFKYFQLENSLYKELLQSDSQSEDIKSGLASSYDYLGLYYNSLNQPDEALKYFELENELYNEIYDNNPKSVYTKKWLAVSNRILGDLYLSSGQHEKATQYLESEKSLREEICKNNPNLNSLKADLASTCIHLGLSYKSIGKFDIALQHYELANKIYKELYNSDSEYKLHLAISCGVLGKLYESLYQFDNALKSLALGNKLYKELYQSAPETYKTFLAESFQGLGKIYMATRKREMALQSFDSENKLLRQLNESDSPSEDIKYRLAISSENLGLIYLSLKDFDSAQEFFELENKLFKELHESSPKDESYKHSLAISYDRLADLYKAMGKKEKALEFFETENKLFRELLEFNPHSIAAKNGLAISYRQLAFYFESLSQFEEALKYFEFENNIYVELHEVNPESKPNNQNLKTSYKKLSIMAQYLGKFSLALEYIEKSGKFG